MSSNDLNLAGNTVDKFDQPDQETEFNSGKDTDAFLPAGKDVKTDDVSIAVSKNCVNQFYGLSREELEQYSNENSPEWAKIRWTLLIIMLIGWIGTLIAAIIIVVVAPKCPPSPDLAWFQDGVAYDILPKTFQDSDNDAVGDLKGIESRMHHFSNLSVASIWISPIMDSDNLKQPESALGTLDDFKRLAKKFKKKGIRVAISLGLGGVEVDKVKTGAADDVLRSWAQAGAEGFMLSLALGADAKVYANVSAKFQKILDDEFNKKDDRARVVMTPQLPPYEALEDVSATVYAPRVNCTGLNLVECNMEKMTALITASMEAPWKLLKPTLDMEGCAVCSLALQLTVRGTPNVIHGDEIGLNRAAYKYMKWDDSVSGGFTANESFTYAKSDVESVLAQKAAGFPGTSVYALFKKLAAVRVKESSLKWGTTRLLEGYGDGALVYIREAAQYPPVIVALNHRDGQAVNLVYRDYTHAEVLAAAGVGVEVDKTIKLNAVFMPKGSVLVARLTKSEKPKE